VVFQNTKNGKKTQWLISNTHLKQKQQIKPIRYVVNTHTSQPDLSSAGSNRIIISTGRNIPPPGFESREVVSPNDFECNSTFDNVNNEWFCNLSNIEIPTDVQLLLQLGHRFNLPVTLADKERTVVEFIKNIEKNISKLNDDICHSIRNDSLPILNKFNNFNPRSNRYNNLINHWSASTKEFTKNNPDLLFTKADKGNVTVVLEKNDYVRRIEDMLSDANTYTVIHKDLLKKLTTDTRSLLVRWKREGYIDSVTYRRMLID